MMSKTIKKVLDQKLKEWVDSVDDPEIQHFIRSETIVTGGAIASMLLNEEVKDFDVYFKTWYAAYRVADYYVKKFNKTHNRKIEVKNESDGRVKIHIQSDGVASEDNKHLDDSFADIYDVIKEDETKSKYRPIFLSSNAITLSNKIQIVVRFYGDPETIHSNYDFVHCTNYYDYGKGELVLKKEALEAILTKTLIYQGSKYPICSVVRTRKFISRGWHINAGQYFKMCLQISQLDLTDIKVLEDQLVGVDSAYFMILIDALKQQKEGNPNFKIDHSYIVSIIDKVF